MDRYVLVISFCQTDEGLVDKSKCLQSVKQLHERLVDISTQESDRGISVFPACSLSGRPSVQRWYFALQACQGGTQFCSSDWEELVTAHQKTGSEEENPSAVESCLSCLSNQEAMDQKLDPSAVTELIEEAAEGLHLLSDKLPPPGKALLDVLMLCSAEQSPPIKDMLPLLGALKHMSCWHAAKTTLVAQHTTGWQKAAAYLSADLVETTDLYSCIDHRELWRGGLSIREKKYVSELRFDGFSLRTPVHQLLGSSLLQAPYITTDYKLQSEVFHYYAPVLDLVQLVELSDLPNFLISGTQFELNLSGKSMKAKLLLHQLRSLSGKVGALFSLSCIITPVAQPTANQLSSQRWRESIAKRPKSLPVPDVEVKGENAHYLLLVQGSNNTECGACSVRMLHSDSQINGAAAMATVSGLLRGNSLKSSEGAVINILDPLPCLQGANLLKREKKVTQVQTLVLKEYLRQKEDKNTSASTQIPLNDLKAILSLAREQYLKMLDSSLPSTASCLTDRQESTVTKNSDVQSVSHLESNWPERSVLHNIENLQRRRQKKRFGLLGPGSSDSLLGPKDSQKAFPALLDARELLKHFTSEGLPRGELQPLAINRGHNAFQLSPDLSPRRASQMSFNKASASHYHGIEFCLDNQRSLDRDQAFVKLQTRLIRYETQTTCSKEPCAIPFALSPAPSPAVMSEPGSVSDGETLQNADVARLKRRSWDTEITGCYPRKRLVKSESSDSLCSQSSSSSGTHPIIRSLRQQPHRSQSTSSSVSLASSSASRHTSSGSMTHPSADKPQQPKTHHGPAEDKPAKESRSQKHNRMLSEVVAKTLQQHGVSSEHECFEACSKRLFDISKFYLKDLKTSRGLHEEMKKAANNNVKQVIEWVLEKTSKK